MVIATRGRLSRTISWFFAGVLAVSSVLASASLLLVHEVAAAGSLPAPALASPHDGAAVKGTRYSQSWNPVSGAVKYQYESYHDAAGAQKRWSETITGISKTNLNISDATYWWRVRAVDAANVPGEWSPLWKLTIDTSQPRVDTVAILQSLASNDVTISGRITDQTAVSVQAFVDDVAFGSAAAASGGNYSITLNNIAEGNRKITITATDAAGNVTSTSRQFTVTDHMAPVIALHDIAPATVGSDVAVSGSVNEPGVTAVQLYVNGAPYSSPVAVSERAFSGMIAGLGVGSYEITAKAKDAAGNEGTSEPKTATVAAIPDTTAPRLELGAIQPITEGGVLRVSGNIDDPSIEKVYIWVGSVQLAEPVDVEDGAFSFTITGLSVGSHKITVRATDAAENEGISNVQLATVNAKALPLPTTPVGETPQGEVPNISDDEEREQQSARYFTAPLIAVENHAALGNNNAAIDSKDPVPVTQDQDIKGITDAADDNTFSPLGFAWYWWLLALAAIAGLGALLAALRRRKGQA